MHHGSSSSSNGRIPRSTPATSPDVNLLGVCCVLHRSREGCGFIAEPGPEASTGRYAESTAIPVYASAANGYRIVVPSQYHAADVLRSKFEGAGPQASVANTAVERLPRCKGQ